MDDTPNEEPHIAWWEEQRRFFEVELSLSVGEDLFGGTPEGLGFGDEELGCRKVGTRWVSSRLARDGARSSGAID